jgi:hypothetical protein
VRIGRSALVTIGCVVALAACSSDAPTGLSANVISPFQGEWNSVSAMPPATLSLTSRGDSLFGTLRLSGREVVVAGAGDGSSFIVHEDPEGTLTLHAVSLDHRTLKARLDADGSSVNLLLVRRIVSPE